MAANSPRSQKLLLLGGYAILAVGFVLAGIVPYVRSTRGAQEQIQRYQEEMDARQAKKVELDETVRRVRVMSQQMPNFDRLVPANQDMAGFLDMLFREGKKAQLKDLSVKNMPATPLARSERLPIEVRGKGTYDQFRKFLMGMENLPRSSSVGRIAIESADSELGGEIEVQITLYIYNARQQSHDQ